LGITDALFLREKRPSISAWAMAMRIQHALKVVVALAMGLIAMAHVWLNPIDH